MKYRIIFDGWNYKIEICWFRFLGISVFTTWHGEQKSLKRATWVAPHIYESREDAQTEIESLKIKDIDEQTRLRKAYKGEWQ